MDAPELPPSVDPFAQVPATELQGPPAPPPPPAAKRQWIGLSDEAMAKGREVRKQKKEELKARQESMLRARKAREKKGLQRALIKEKLKKGLPINEREYNEIASRSPSLLKGMEVPPKMTAEQSILIKPATIAALRVVVEQTAAKFAYNPIEGLLKELNDPDLSAKDRVTIHKTLLPFLLPQIAPAKEEHVEPTPQASKITIKSFHIGAKDEKPIHETKKQSLGPAIQHEDESSPEI